MIKIFGKLRYHWQPELSLSIIYWSLVTIPFMIYMILLYERIRPGWPFVLLMAICFIMSLLGFHRYFIIEADGRLRITSANPLKSCTIDIASIKKIEVTYSTVTLYADRFPQGKTFHMRRWPKKYFINAIALVPDFKGEVELTDHLIKVDYFDMYYSEKNKR